MEVHVSTAPFNKKKDTDSLCMTITGMYMRGAPKKKICPATLLELVRSAAYISMTNVFIAAIELVKHGIEEGHTMEEILGQLQIEFKDAWDLLARSKIGANCFKKIELETIINASNPTDLLKNSVINEKR